MNQRDFIYNQTYKGALNAGATERASHYAAVMAIDDYKKGKYKKITDLIKAKITEAKKSKG